MSLGRVHRLRKIGRETAPLSDAVEPKFSPRSCRVYSNLAPRSKMLPTALRDSQFFRRVYAVVTRWRYFSSALTMCKLFPLSLSPDRQNVSPCSDRVCSNLAPRRRISVRTREKIHRVAQFCTSRYKVDNILAASTRSLREGDIFRRVGAALISPRH